MTYAVVTDKSRPAETTISRHRTLRAAGKAYQAAHAGNMRAVLDSDCRVVTSAACDAINNSH